MKYDSLKKIFGAIVAAEIIAGIHVVPVKATMQTDTATPAAIETQADAEGACESADAEDQTSEKEQGTDSRDETSAPAESAQPAPAAENTASAETDAEDIADADKDVNDGDQNSDQADSKDNDAEKDSDREVSSAAEDDFVTITSQPQSTEIRDGDTASFTVRAEGKDIAFQWQYSLNGEEWTDYENGTDSAFSTVYTADQSGIRVRCVLTSGDVTVYTDPVSVTVTMKEEAGAKAAKSISALQAEPEVKTASVTEAADTSAEDTISVTQQPQDTEVEPGGRATFTAEAKGTGLTYRWQYRLPGGDWKYWSKGTGKTLSRNISSAWNGIEVRCEITGSNSVRIYTTAATVTVKEASEDKIKITAQPQSTEAEPGANVTMTAQAEGEDLTYRWQYRLPGGDWKYWSKGTGTTLSRNIREAWNNIEIRCEITNTNGDQVYTNTAKVTLTTGGGSDVKITTQPQSTEVEPGGRATFTTSAEGTGLTYRWQYKLPGGDWKYWSKGTGTTLSRNISEAWNNIQVRCEITDAGGEKVFTDTATVTVKAVVENIKITEQPKSTAVKAGGTATFTTSAEGTGLTYRWQYRLPGGDWKYWSKGTGTTLSRSIREAWNNIEVRCEITDESGSKEYTETATAKIKAGIKITGQPTGATVEPGGRATFTTSAEGTGLTYRWQYKLPANGNWTYWTKGTGDTLTKSFKAAWNNIQVRCEITDEDGDTGYTNAVTVIVREDQKYSVQYSLYDNDSYLQTLQIVNPNPDTYTSSKGLTLGELVVAGYDFEGWYDGQGSSANRVTAIAQGETGARTLYAKWKLHPYEIQFDSPLSPVESKTYTTNKGVTLDNPSLTGYTFIGWSNDDGHLVDIINPGTTGDFVLHANWMSLRNQTISKRTQTDPIIYEDKENGQFLFVYEIGRIENVPLYTIKDFGYNDGKNGIVWETTTVISGTITEGNAKTIANTISNATTMTYGWTLSKDWNTTTTIDEEHLSEINKTHDEVVNDVVNENGNYYITTGDKGKHTHTTKTGASANVSGKVTAELGAEVSVPLKVATGKVYVKNGVEIGGNAASYRKDTDTQSSNWSVNTGYQSSQSESHSSSVSDSLSQRIADKYGYSLAKSIGGSESKTYSDSNTQTDTREYSTTVSYFTTKMESETTKYTNANAAPGYYRLVKAGTVHVFSVVGYDIATHAYYVYTYNVLDDEVKDFMDYSKVTGGYDDYETGVLTFEVPYEVKEYVDNAMASTDGLQWDTDTGMITKYSGTKENVSIPEYVSSDNKDGTYTAVKITGISSKAFQGNSNVKAVFLNKNITEIPDGAFKDCTGLELVSCGDGLTSIGSSAFAGCTSMDTITIPKTVTSLGENAFSGVSDLKVTAANASVVKAAINSGARRITINISGMSDTLSDYVITIGEGTEYFRLDGGGITLSGIRVVSRAKETILSGLTFKDNTEVPLKLYSPSVTLNNLTVEADGLGLTLQADTTDLKLFRRVYITSAGQNAILARNVKAAEEDASIYSKLCITGNMMVCGNADGTGLLDFASGKLINIDEDSYNSLLTDSLAWVKAEEVPEGATILSQKWTYDETTTKTSKIKDVEGYTCYDTTEAWGDYGAWSGWTTNEVNASDSRQVQTNYVNPTYKTQYNYSRWRASNGHTGPLQGTWGGSYCGTYQELGWRDSPLSVTSTQYSSRMGGNFNIYNEPDAWYNQTTRSVQTGGGYKQYRYRDRAKVYTYYLKKTETKESDTEVAASDTITNVQKWVKYVI